MNTQHQDYLYRTRKKRLTRAFRFGGETNNTTIERDESKVNKKILYPYYGRNNENQYETRDRPIWFHLLLPFIVLFTIFLNPALGILVAFLSLVTVSFFFWDNLK